LEHSIASLLRQERRRLPDLDPTPYCNHQLALWEMKQVVLAGRPNLTIDYYDLVARPADNIERLIDYLDLTPGSAQVAEAKARIRPPGAGAETA
jgi:hypothetical protein